MGAYFMRRQKDSAEYLLAGRSVAWFAIGLSLLSSLNSAGNYVTGDRRCPSRKLRPHL